MRTVLAAVVFAACATAVGAFPPPLTPEQPVSQRVLGPAAGDQQTLAVASNGQIGFAVWLDQRRGSSDPDLYGSRIDLAGASLDPTGIPIARSVSGGTVIWNGTAFVVVSEDNSVAKMFTFITPDGVQVEQKLVDLPAATEVQTFAASMGSGPEARMLFAGRASATIVDANGNIVAANVRFPLYGSLLAAGSSKSEFLVLRSSIPNRISADHLDRDGKLISTTDTGLDLSMIGTGLSLAGGIDNYLLVAGAGKVAAYLDLNGIAKVPATALAPSDDPSLLPYPQSKTAVVFDGVAYLVGWTAATNGQAYAALARMPAEVGTAPPVLTYPLQWSGAAHGAVLGIAGKQVMLIVDAFRTGISTTIDPIAKVLDAPYDPGPLPPPLASSVTRQKTPQVASSNDQYAVVWTESGPDGANHLYLRRFSLTATPIDPAPVEVASDTSGQAITARIAAAGGLYVVAWSVPDGFNSNYVLRRLSAATGSWMDAEPVPLATHGRELTLGSSGGSILAAYVVDCSPGLCMRARAIATDSGLPLRTAETLLTSPASDISIGSNGTDFLVVWTDNYCFDGCDIISPYNLYVERVAADGTPLDAKPLALDRGYQLRWPSIAGTGSAYVVMWVDSGFGTLKASRVTADGVFADAQHALQVVTTGDFERQRVLAIGSGLLLLTTRSNTLAGTTLDAQSLASTGMPFTIETDQLPNETFSASSVNGGIVITYDRVDADSGSVERVFSRLFGNTPRRRSAR